MPATTPLLNASSCTGTLLILIPSIAPLGTGFSPAVEKRPLASTCDITCFLRASVARLLDTPLVSKSNSTCTGAGVAGLT
ncbi:hypothetical protein D3C87_1772720 [compost metagenome]